MTASRGSWRTRTSIRAVAAVAYVSFDVIYVLLDLHWHAGVLFLASVLPALVAGWIIGRRWSIYLSLSGILWVVVESSANPAYSPKFLLVGSIGAIMLNTGLLALGVWISHWHVRQYEPTRRRGW